MVSAVRSPSVRVRLLVVSLAVVAGGISAGSSVAVAAPRYASPSGSGESCSSTTPCQLKQAITGAANGDEVIVGSGSYALAANEVLATSLGVTGVNIHGDPAGPPPAVVGSTTGALLRMSPGGRLSYLGVTNDHEDSGAIECSEGGLVERVTAATIDDSSTTLYQRLDCLVRDSVVRATGKESFAIVAAGAKAGADDVNVTAIATGPESTGILAETANLGDPYTLRLTDSIVSGEAADLRPYAEEDRIAASHSNFNSIQKGSESMVIDLGGNQSAPPLFVNAAGGDFREAPGSPTIDAGIANALAGPLDLTGSPRASGSAPDIGAYELVPPPLPPAVLQSLSLKPVKFRAGTVPGALASAKKKGKKQRKAPLGTTVGYALSSPGSVSFTVEAVTKGRRVGKKCKAQTRANRGKKHCTVSKALGGGFSAGGGAGANQFKFSGRLAGQVLRPGNYRLVGAAGGVAKSVAFKIVR